MTKNENYRQYGRKTPPDYELGNVKVPVQLYYGNRDLLLDKVVSSKGREKRRETREEKDREENQECLKRKQEKMLRRGEVK